MTDTLHLTAYIGIIPFGYGVYAMRDAINANQKAIQLGIDRSEAVQAAAWSAICLGQVLVLHWINGTSQNERANYVNTFIMRDVVGMLQLWIAFGAVAPSLLVPMLFGRLQPLWRKDGARAINVGRKRSRILWSLLALVCLVQVYLGSLCMVIMHFRWSQSLH